MGGGGAVVRAVVKQGAVRQIRPQAAAQLHEAGRVPLLQADLLGVDHGGKIVRQPEPLQRGPAQGGAAGGEHRHGDALLPALAEEVCRPRLQGGQIPVVVEGQSVPLRHDVLRGVGQVVIVPGELGRDGVDGAGHHVRVFWGGRQPPAGQELLIHLQPEVVGVGDGAVQIK